MFKTETHLHVKEISRCGMLTAEEMVEYYKAAGYHTIFVTDHFEFDYVEPMGGKTWEEVVYNHFRGYRAAKEVGDRLGVVVLPSVELELNYFPNHYLLYGDVEAFLARHEKVYEMSLPDFFALAQRENILVVQAHPYRDAACYPTVEYVDGIEVYNSNQRHEDYSPKSLALARENGKYMLSGSDAHRVEDTCKGGILTKEPIECVEDFVRAIKTGEYELIREGAKAYLISDTHAERNFEGFDDYLEMAGDDDLLILLGDVFFGYDYTPEIAEYNEWFLSLDKNIALVGGNHDNYVAINSYPVEEWCGGLVNRITEKIVYLRRGEIYNIKGKSVFVFGGCKSSAKWYKMGVASEGEIPTEEEIAYAKAKLASVGNKVDFILTHKYEAGLDRTVTEILLDFVKYLEENVEYKRWFYGHYHDDKTVDKKHVMVYKVLRELGLR